MFSKNTESIAIQINENFAPNLGRDKQNTIFQNPHQNV